MSPIYAHAEMMTRQVHECTDDDTASAWSAANWWSSTMNNCSCPKIRVPPSQALRCELFCQKSRLSRPPEAPLFGKISRFSQNPEAPIFREICHCRKFLNRQIAVKIHRVSSEISGKFGTFGIITWCIGSIPTTSVGFPTEAPTFSTGVPFYVII